MNYFSRILALCIGMAACSSGFGCRVIRDGGVYGTGIPRTGNGEVTTEIREAAPFSRLDFRGPMKAVVRIGTGHSIKLRIDRNLHRFIKTELQGDTLLVHPDAAFYSNKILEVEVTLPGCSRISVEGEADLKVERLIEPEFELLTSGWGAISLSGRVDRLKIDSAGSSHVKAANVVSTTADVHLKGVGDVTITVKSKLNARLEGSGEIDYFGNPRVVEKRISGVGMIRKAD